MLKYFGDPWPSDLCDSSEQIPVPVGAPCQRCGEVIEQGDQGVMYSNGPVAHRNCFLRSILGSVAHIEKRCSCYVEGAEEGDPPGLTKREGANAAVAVWALQEMSKRPYTVSQGEKGPAFIHCHTCHKTSFNTLDILNKYCGYCHKFHQEY